MNELQKQFNSWYEENYIETEKGYFYDSVMGKLKFKFHSAYIGVAQFQLCTSEQFLKHVIALCEEGSLQEAHNLVNELNSYNKLSEAKENLYMHIRGDIDDLKGALNEVKSFKVKKR